PDRPVMMTRYSGRFIFNLSRAQRGISGAIATFAAPPEILRRFAPQDKQIPGAGQARDDDEVFGTVHFQFIPSAARDLRCNCDLRCATGDPSALRASG